MSSTLGRAVGPPSLRDGWSPPPVHLSVISQNGGLGDMLARLPALKYLAEQHQHVTKIVTYWPDYFVSLAQFMTPTNLKLVHKPISEAPYLMPKPYIDFTSDRLSTLHLNLVDHAYLMLMDQLPPTAMDKHYLRAPFVMDNTLDMPDVLELKQEIIVFTTDFTSHSRSWPAFHINSLAKKVKDAGFQPVLLGKPGELFGGAVASYSSGLKTELFMDLRGRTSLIEALGIIQRAKAVVGVDNGLLHLAACTDTPIVFGLTTLKPEHRVPTRPMPIYLPRKRLLPYPKDLHTHFRVYGLTHVLEAQVPCNGCQSRGFAINVDWRDCLFDDYSCTLTLTADRFYEKLVRLGVLD